MATDSAAAAKGPGSNKQLMEQVAEYVRVSKETSQVAYDLACMAQDLGSLWSSKRRTDEKSVAANTMINNIVGDRRPYTFGKRGSDTIPTGLAALSNFLSEDPRHFGVRLSTLFTGSNFIQERRKVTTVTMPAASDFDSSSSSESEISSSSRSSGSATSVVSSLSSEEMDNFDAQRWYQKVDKLVSTIQSKEEWETISALREGYSFKDTERAADLVHVEALADFNDEELRSYESTREKLETQVEAKQLEMLSALTTFSESLKKTTREVIHRRRARKRVKKKFSFSNMDEVRFVVKDGDEEPEESKDGAPADVQTSTAEVDSIKGHRAGELLTQISGLQSNMNELVRDAHLKKQTLDVHQKALSFLEGALEAAENGDDPPDPEKDIQELLHKMQAEVKQAVDAEKRYAATERLKEVSTDSTILTEELLQDMEPKQLKVHLTQFENDVEMLQKKVQELETARIAEARGGAERAQRSRKAALIAQQHPLAEGASNPAEAASRRNSLNAPAGVGAADTRGDGGKNGRASPSEIRRRLLSGDVPPPSKLVSALEEQVPAAKQAVDALEAHKVLFLKSVEKAKDFRDKLSIDIKAIRRSILAAQEAAEQATEAPPAPASPTSKATASPTAKMASPKATAPAAAEKRAEAGVSESPRRRRASRSEPSRSQVKPRTDSSPGQATAQPAGAAEQPVPQASATDGGVTPAAAGVTAAAPVAAGLKEKKAPPEAASAPGEAKPRRALRNSTLEGLPEGTAQQMKALKEATKAYNRAHHDAHHLGKLLDLDLEKLADGEAKVMLRAKQLGFEKKQAQIEDLQKELEELQQQAGIEPSATAAGGAPSSRSTTGGFPGSPSIAASPRMEEFQKAKLEHRRVIEELLKMEGAMNPELLKELLQAQGENLHIQEQLANLDEALRLLRAKGKDLSPDELQKIKALIAPPKQADDPGDPQVQELRNEKRRMRGLQKEVQDKRGEWSGIEGVSQALRGFGEGMNPADILRKVRMVNAATARQANSSEENSPVNRASTSTHPELATLQAAATIARTKDARDKKMEQEGRLLSPGSSPRTPGTTTSAAAKLLADAVSAMSAANSAAAKGPKRSSSRRASANDLVALNVPMHVAINLRRRQSLAAGLKAAQQQSERQDDGQLFAISTLGSSSQANSSATTARPVGRNRRATDAEASAPRRFSGFAGFAGGRPPPRRVSVA